MNGMRKTKNVRVLFGHAEKHLHSFGISLEREKRLSHGGKLWYSIFDKSLTELEVKNV